MNEILAAAVAFIVIFGSVVVIHELGHFAAARALGIRVLRFSVGFGPRLAGFTSGDTEYRLSLLPLGGYVKLAGEGGGATGAPDEFESRPRRHRVLVAIAGPAANVALALVLPAVVALVGFEAYAYRLEPPVVANTRPGSPAEAAGLEPGDRIVSIDGRRTRTWLDVEEALLVRPGHEIRLEVEHMGAVELRRVRLEAVGAGGTAKGFLGAAPPTGGGRVVVGALTPGSPAERAGLSVGDEIVSIDGVELGADRDELIRRIEGSRDRAVALALRRGDGSSARISLTPETTGGAPRIGIRPDVVDVPKTRLRLGPLEAMRYSLDVNTRFLRLTASVLAQVLSGRRAASESVAGPIAMAEASGKAAAVGFRAAAELTAYLSLSIGLFNLLPIPVLDGGLILLLAIEWALGAAGLALSERAKYAITAGGFFVVLALSFFALAADLTRLLGAEEPSPRPPPGAATAAVSAAAPGEVRASR